MDQEQEELQDNHTPPTEDNSSDIQDFEPLEDLDDEEFGIPPISQPQTLEEILNDPDALDQTSLDDEETTGPILVNTSGISATLPGGIALSNLSDTLSLHSKGSADNRSRSSANRRRQRDQDKRGSIMRHVILKGISTQMNSACERVNAGLPTVMTAGNLIAVGTSHGFILVFDNLQVMKWCLGGRTYGDECGSVSSLAFNHDSSRLLVGFAKGHLIEFDIQTGKLLRTLDEAHPLGSAIVHCRFTDDPTLAIISDSGGSVFEITFKRTLGVRGFNSRCIFSGSRGEVCTFEPLSLGQYPDHPLAEQSIVALATISKVIILTVRPSMKVLFTHSLTGTTDTLPILSWQFVIIQTTSSEKVVDPVIAFGRQSTLYFYQLSENLAGKVMFIALQKMELPYVLMNFGWLNTRCIATLDNNETFHLIDVRSQDNLESIDLSDVELCYGSSFFKGLATGGNVSAAMARAGERATYSSVTFFTNQILLLGRRTFHVLIIRAWNERLDHLVKENRYLDAIALGSEFYQDQGKALVGLKGPREKRKTVISQKLINLLLKFLDVSMNKNFPAEGNMSLLKDYFADVVPPCINVCIVLKRKDLLFENVWNAYNVDPFARATFLDGLEAFILSDQLRNIPVTISQEFVSHFELSGRFEALEACITHIEVTSLDIHQVMSLCWLHGMYDAIIYIFNNGMLDYITPTEELMTELANAIAIGEALNPQQIKLGNKLLVYISCCLAGRAYPYGNIAEDRVAQVKYDVYNCITSLHTKKSREDEHVYPYLRTLLHFDTQGFLNVISIAFDEPEFTSELGRCQKQRLVDILLQIMVDGEGFTPPQIGYLFTFLARQIAKGDQCLSISRSLFEKVLEVLTCDTAESSHKDERQQALYEMLVAGGLIYFDREHLLAQAEKAGFYRILEMLYEKTGDYEKIMECYINDEARKIQCFALIQKVFLESDIGDDDDHDKKGKIEKSVIKHLETIMDIDAKKTAMVIFHHMYNYIPLVVSKLESNKPKLFEFLRYSLEYKESGSTPNTPVRKLEAEDLLASPKTYEKYIELMCELDPKAVASYLKSKDTYEIAPILKICKARGLVDAEAYLLEKDGRIKEAFQLMKQKLDKKISELVSSDGDRALLWTQMNATVVVIIQLCQRTVNSLDESEREELWFALLESLMQPQRDLTAEEAAPFKEVVRHLVNSTLGYVPMRTMTQKILKDPVYENSSFGEIKEFLSEMLEMYHYEETLLGSTCRLLQLEVHNQMVELNRAQNRGYSVASLNCGLCRSHLALQDGVVFQCRHHFHLHCLQKAGCVSISEHGEELWQCYGCVMADGQSPKRRGIKSAKTATVGGGNKKVSTDIIQEITDHKLVKARQYLNKFKTPHSYLDEDSEFRVSDSIFDDPEFPLNPQPRSSSHD